MANIIRIVCVGDSNIWGYNPENEKRVDDDVRQTGPSAKPLMWNFCENTNLLPRLLPREQIFVPLITESGDCNSSIDHPPTSFQRKICNKMSRINAFSY